MRCPAVNSSGTKFCGKCGAALKLKCVRRGFENVPEIKFECGQRLGEPSKQSAAPDLRAYTPKHLAEKILTSRSALEGERKQVTVLFADVKGSMDLAEQIGPEEWHQIMDRFFRILADGVHRFEGTVNEYRGDGLIAEFPGQLPITINRQRRCFYGNG